MTEQHVDSDEEYVFKSRLRRSKVTLAVGIAGLIIGVGAGGFFLYLILTQFTDDVSLLLAPGILVVVGLACLVMSHSLKSKMKRVTPELWDAYQKMRREVPSE